MNTARQLAQFKKEALNTAILNKPFMLLLSSRSASPHYMKVNQTKSASTQLDSAITRNSRETKSPRDISNFCRIRNIVSRVRRLASSEKERAQIGS